MPTRLSIWRRHTCLLYELPCFNCFPISLGPPLRKFERSFLHCPTCQQRWKSFQMRTSVSVVDTSLLIGLLFPPPQGFLVLPTPTCILLASPPKLCGGFCWHPVGSFPFFRLLEQEPSFGNVLPSAPPFLPREPSFVFGLETPYRSGFYPPNANSATSPVFLCVCFSCNLGAPLPGPFYSNARCPL